MKIQNDRIRILHLIATNFIGGPEKQIIGHLRHLDTDRFEIHVGSFLEGATANSFLTSVEAMEFPILKLPHSSPFDFSPLRKLKHYLGDNRIHGLITHGYKPNIFGNLASTNTKTAHGMYVRGWTSENFKIQIYNWLDKKFLKRGDLVISVARRKLEELQGLGIKKDRLRYIANAVQIPELNEPDLALRAKYGFENKALIIAAAGRLSPEKGHSVLLRSVREFLDRGHDAGCVIFGDGPEKANLESEIEALGLSNDVKLGGFCADWKNYLPEIDILVNPSYSEVMPNVVLESMACGCPVIATAVGGVGELIPDEGYGWLVPPGEPEVLADHFEHYLHQQDQLSTMVEKARNHVVENFTFSEQAKRLHDLYLELWKIGETR